MVPFWIQELSRTHKMMIHNWQDTFDKTPRILRASCFLLLPKPKPCRWFATNVENISHCDIRVLGLSLTSFQDTKKSSHAMIIHDPFLQPIVTRSSLELGFQPTLSIMNWPHSRTSGANALMSSTFSWTLTTRNQVTHERRDHVSRQVRSVLDGNPQFDRNTSLPIWFYDKSWSIRSQVWSEHLPWGHWMW